MILVKILIRITVIVCYSSTVQSKFIIRKIKEGFLKINMAGIK